MEKKMFKINPYGILRNRYQKKGNNKIILKYVCKRRNGQTCHIFGWEDSMPQKYSLKLCMYFTKTHSKVGILVC